MSLDAFARFLESRPYAKQLVLDVFREVYHVARLSELAPSGLADLIERNLPLTQIRAVVRFRLGPGPATRDEVAQCIEEHLCEAIVAQLAMLGDSAAGPGDEPDPPEPDPDGGGAALPPPPLIDAPLAFLYLLRALRSEASRKLRLLDLGGAVDERSGRMYVESELVDSILGYVLLEEDLPAACRSICRVGPRPSSDQLWKAASKVARRLVDNVWQRHFTGQYTAAKATFNKLVRECAADRPLELLYNDGTISLEAGGAAAVAGRLFYDLAAVIWSGRAADKDSRKRHALTGHAEVRAVYRHVFVDEARIEQGESVIVRRGQRAHVRVPSRSCGALFDSGRPGHLKNTPIRGNPGRVRPTPLPAVLGFSCTEGLDVSVPDRFVAKGPGWHRGYACCGTVRIVAVAGDVRVEVWVGRGEDQRRGADVRLPEGSSLEIEDDRTCSRSWRLSAMDQRAGVLVFVPPLWRRHLEVELHRGGRFIEHHYLLPLEGGTPDDRISGHELADCLPAVQLPTIVRVRVRQGEGPVAEPEVPEVGWVLAVEEAVRAMGGRAIEQSSLLSALFNQSVLSSNHDVARPALLVDDVIPKEEREPGDHPSAVGVVRSEEALGRLAVRAARLASEVRLRLAKGEAEAELVNELATHAVLLELAEAIGEDPHVLAQAMVEKLKP